jgi:hypothetical protein
MLWRMLVLELWHRNFMEARSEWANERKAPEILASEIGSLFRTASGMAVPGPSSSSSADLEKGTLTPP